ncbi:MAG: sulfotransferase [Chloroflexota bacterium]|nr:sulfotransferase [Chloroflexota bacterium]
MKVGLLLISGVGRSGTSLLQSMFAAHPYVAYMPETSFIRRYLIKGVLRRLFQTEGDDGVIRALEADRVFSRTGLSATSLIQEAIGSGGQLDATIYRSMVRSWSDVEQYWVGDKDPRLIEFYPVVKAIFPAAVVLNIIRDPRDVLASKKKAAWSKGSHVWKHIFANRVQLKLGQSNGPRLFGENYHEIIYEELIASPEVVLTELCRKIGLPFDEAMLSFGDAARKLVSESEVSWKKETFGPLLKDNKEKWKSALSPREIRLTELCCREAMAAGKYESDKRKHHYSLTDRLWILAGSIVIKLAAYPYLVYRHLTVTRVCRRLE